MNRLLMILCAFVAGCLLCGPASAQCGPVRKVAARTACVAKKASCRAISVVKEVVDVGVNANRRAVSLAYRGSCKILGIPGLRSQCNSVRIDCDNVSGTVFIDGLQELPAYSQSTSAEPTTVGRAPVSVVERQRSRTVTRCSVVNCANGNCQQ